MGRCSPLLALLLALGCASFEVTTAEGTVVKSSAYGRGCVAVDTLPDGTASVIIAQDGTSDWSIGRMLGWIGELAAPIFGGSNRPAGMESPSLASGCAQIMEGGPDP